MGLSGRFTLLLIYGDRTRILRLTFPRWGLWAGLGFLGLAVSTLGAISGDYASLRRQLPEVHALQRQVGGQQAFINSSHRRIAEVRAEISSWRALHAKIWEPLGPEASPAGKGTGIGGGESVEAPFPGDRTPLAQELDLLAATVKDEGQHLQLLERFMHKARPVLAARLAQRH